MESLVGIPLLIIFLPIIAGAIFDLLLRLDPYGRLVLSENQIKLSNWTIACITIACIALLIGVFTTKNAAFGIATWCMFMIIPISFIYRAKNLHAKRILYIYTALIIAIGLTPLLILLNSSGLVILLAAVSIFISFVFTVKAIDLTT
jgi:hypothetical protein